MVWAGLAGSVNVRRILRNRARYEVANNSYARGIVLTLANDVIGTGPRLQMLAEGKSTKNTALTLHVSPKTIESNRRRIMEKLDIHSVAELTKYAVREGLTDLES